MELLDPSKKRAHNIRLFVGYVLVGIAILIAATILLFQALGYDVNRNTGEVIQNGLVFVSSHPGSAEVYLNGQDKGSTNRRFAIPAGRYTVALKKAGYSTWTRTFNLDGGSVLQLVYPLLFPTKLVTNEIATYKAAPMLVTKSPDKKHMVVFDSSFKAGFDTYDLTKSPATKTNTQYSSGLITSPNSDKQKLSLVEWSTDNRHLIVKHAFGAKYEYLLIDTRLPSQSVNLTKKLPFAPSKISLRDKNYDQYYLYNKSNKSLYSYQLQTNTKTLVLKNLTDYKPYGGSTIMYISPTSKNKTVQVKIYDKGKSYTLHAYPAGPSYRLNMASYGGHLFATVDSSGGFTYIFENALDEASRSTTGISPTLALKLDGPAYSSFSENARFIVSQNKSEFEVYDAETTNNYSYKIKQKIMGGHAEWMDGHRLVLNVSGKTYVFDYDGINRRLLSSSIPGYPSVFNNSYSQMFTIAKSVKKAGQYAILSTDLVVK